MDATMFMQNEPNSGWSRAGHRSAGHAGSWHAEMLGSPDLGFGIMPEAGTHAARNGIGGPKNWTTGVQQVPPEEWRVARKSGEWSGVSESQGRELAATEKRQNEGHRPKTGQIRVFQLDTWQAFARFLLIRRGGGPAEWE